MDWSLRGISSFLIGSPATNWLWKVTRQEVETQEGEDVRVRIQEDAAAHRALVGQEGNEARGGGWRRLFSFFARGVQEEPVVRFRDHSRVIKNYTQYVNFLPVQEQERIHRLSNHYQQMVAEDRWLEVLPEWESAVQAYRTLETEEEKQSFLQDMGRELTRRVILARGVEIDGERRIAWHLNRSGNEDWHYITGGGLPAVPLGGNERVYFFRTYISGDELRGVSLYDLVTKRSDDLPMGNTLVTFDLNSEYLRQAVEAGAITISDFYGDNLEVNDSDWLDRQFYALRAEDPEQQHLMRYDNTSSHIAVPAEDWLSPPVVFSPDLYYRRSTTNIADTPFRSVAENRGEQVLLSMLVIAYTNIHYPVPRDGDPQQFRNGRLEAVSQMIGNWEVSPSSEVIARPIPNRERPIHVAFDLDLTLIYSIRAEDNFESELPEDVIRIEFEAEGETHIAYYQVRPYAREVLEVLNRYGFSLSFFSDRSEQRNRAVAEAIFSDVQIFSGDSVIRNNQKDLRTVTGEPDFETATVADFDYNRRRLSFAKRTELAQADAARANRVEDALLIEDRPQGGDVEGQFRNALVLSVPDDLMMYHLYRENPLAPLLEDSPVIRREFISFLRSRYDLVRGLGAILIATDRIRDNPELNFVDTVHELYSRPWSESGDVFERGVRAIRRDNPYSRFDFFEEFQRQEFGTEAIRPWSNAEEVMSTSIETQRDEPEPISDELIFRTLFSQEHVSLNVRRAVEQMIINRIGRLMGNLHYVQTMFSNRARFADELDRLGEEVISQYRRDYNIGIESAMDQVIERELDREQESHIFRNDRMREIARRRLRREENRRRAARPSRGI